MSTEQPSFPNNWKKSSRDETRPGVLRENESGKENSEKTLIGENQNKGNIIDSFLANEESLAAYREKLSAIKKFVQAMQEIAPIIDAVSSDIESTNEFKQRISSLLTLQVSFVNLIKDQWDLHDNDANDKYILSVIAKHVSDLIATGFLKSNKDYDRVEGVLDLLDDFIEERPYIGQVIDDNLLSSDVLVNVKLGLFPSSLRFSRQLYILSQNDLLIHHWLKWHQNITVSLAKDLAFNWDTASNFKDREKLFESSLIHCSVIAEDVWINTFVDQLGVLLTNFTKPSISLLLSEFDLAVQECDMGYLSHKTCNVEWLKDELINYAISLSEGFSIFGRHSLSLRCYLVEKICFYADQAWRDASTKVLEMLDGMDEEQLDKWSRTEGLKPMDFGLLIESLSPYISDIFSEKFGLNEDQLLHDAKSKLAILWGLSDAVCKIKRRDE